MDEKLFSQYLQRGKEVEITLTDGNKEKIFLKPLGMKHFPKIYNIMRDMKDADFEDTKKTMDFLTEPVIRNMLEIVYETLKRSLPKISDEVIEEMTSANFLEIFPEVIELNSGNIGDRNQAIKSRIEQIKKAKNEEIPKTNQST